ncbi:MAG: S26 family signal peptidase, partial [Planctomycetota bacterium]
ERRFEVDAQGPSEMLFKHDVLPYNEVDDDDTLRVEKPFVGDVRLAFELDVERRGQIEVRIVEHGVRHELVLGATASYVRAGGPGSVKRDIDVQLEAGSSYEISFANVDDTLIVVIDGEEFEVEFENTIGTPPELSNQFGTSDIGFLHTMSIVATDVKATITDIDIDRDVYYCERQNRSTYRGTKTWKVPDGHFFMLGDNNECSQDSRLWAVAQARLKDGTVIEFDPGIHEGVKNPMRARPSGGSLVVVGEDVGGLRREFAAADLEDWSSSVERPFVPADHMIGRALSVFWPIYVPRIYSGPSRIKLIR